MQAFIRFLRFFRSARWFATFGAAISFGIIAFGGVGSLVGKSLLFGLTIPTGSLPIVAAAVFLLAVSIESAIFKTSIYEAAKRDENAIKRSIAKREIRELFTKNEDLRNNKFFKIYTSRLKYLHKLEEDNKKYYDSDKDTAESEMILVRQEIEELEMLFFKAISSDDLSGSSIQEKGIIASLKASLEVFLSQYNSINAEVTAKINWVTYASVPLAIGTGICAGLFTIGAILSCWAEIQTLLLTLTGISLGTPALVLLATAACIFAAKGYCLVMYNTVTEMIQNDTLYKWHKEVVNFFKTPQDIIKGIKVIGILALTTLMVFATIATAGTWWHLAKVAVQAAGKAPLALTAILNAAQAVSGVLMILPTFLFNIINGLESGGKLYNKIFGNKGGCDLILMSSPPDKKNIAYLPIKSNAAYVYVRNENKLFYVNKDKKECREVIDFTPEKLSTFNSEMKSSSTAITLTKKQLEKITSITGHTHKEHEHEYEHEHEHEHPKDTNPKKDSDKFNYWNLINPFWYIQQINIFALLFKTFRGAIYIGHITSSGFTADESGVLSAKTGAYMQTLAEGFTDLPFISHSGHSHTHDGFLLNEIEDILGWISVRWDYVFGYCATFGNYKWDTSQEKYYPRAKLPAPPEPLTEDLGIHLTSKAIETQIEIYEENRDSILNTQGNRKSIQKKIGSFKKIKDQLQQTGGNERKKDEKESNSNNSWSGLKHSSPVGEEAATLSEHRNPLSTVYSIFSLKPHKPESQKLIERIENNRSMIAGG